jgi:hypothetical protein
MSVDFQVCFPQVVIPLSSITVLPGMVPRTLSIIGQDFTSIDQVLINDIASPDIVILSKTKLLAQVPAQLVNATLSSVTAVSNRLMIGPRSIIKFQIGTTPSKVSGILRLVQVFLKILLTTPGIDIFAPRIGGAATRDLGLTFGKDQGGSIVSDIIIAVNTTQKQIVTIQGRDPSIPRDERLLSATVTAATYNRAEAALIVSTEIVSQAGRSAIANVMV